MHVSINMSGVDDSVKNYQSYLVACVRLYYSIPMKSIFFRFAIRISIYLLIFLLIYAFSHIFSLRILLLAVENV